MTGCKKLDIVINTNDRLKSKEILKLSPTPPYAFSRYLVIDSSSSKQLVHRCNKRPVLGSKQSRRWPPTRLKVHLLPLLLLSPL